MILWGYVSAERIAVEMVTGVGLAVEIGTIIAKKRKDARDMQNRIAML